MTEVIIPTITALYTGLAGLFIMVLAAKVIMLRRKHKVGIGDGGRTDLMGAIRAHANFIEYVPIIILLLLVLELMGAPDFFLHGVGLTLLAGRVLHGIGLWGSTGSSTERFLGMVLTFAALLTGSLGAMYFALSSMG